MKNNFLNQNFSIKKITYTAVIVIATVLFSGCASVQYKNRGYNNFFGMYSDNCNEYKISVITDNVGFTVDKGSPLEITKFNKSQQNQNLVREVVISPLNLNYEKSNIIVMRNFKKEGLKINLTHANYDTIQLEIKRKVRPGALVKDIGFSLFTLGIPLLVDAYKSDFYKNSKDSKKFKVHFEYSQSFMRDEYIKIANSMEPQYFNEWIAKFPKSEIKKTVINKKDSVELVIAISKGQESAIDEFINSHKESKFIDEAVLIKKEMTNARELYKNACMKNTVESYEEFLLKYPNSLHNKEAHLKLVDAAEKRALESRSSEKIVEYIIRYLKPNAHYITELSLEEKNWAIGKSESDIKFVSSQKLDDKNSRLTKALDELTIKELGALNSNIDYSAYSKMWKKYISLVDNKDIKPFLNSFSQTESYSDEICDVLFNTLKEANTKEKQKVWEEKTLSDFPKFDSLPYMVLSNGKIINNIFIRVLEQQKKGSGQIKLYDVNFIKNSDVIQKYFPLEKIKNYTYKNNYYTTLEGVNVEELNYSKGELNGVNRALRDNVIDITITIKGMTKDISYYQMGKLVKTTYYPDDYRDYYNPLEPGGMGLNLNDYSYEFENGINLTLKMLEEKNKEGLELMKQGNYSEAWSILKKARENNIPKNISENLALDKSISEAKKQVEKIEKQQEEKRLADEKRRREQQIQNNQSSNENQPLSYYAGIYSNGQDLIRLNANGTGVFYMDYISSETVAVKWSVYKNKISLDPTDSEQKYLIFSQYLDFNIINGRSTLSHSTMGGTFIYEKR
jgi:hypothetical protein